MRPVLALAFAFLVASPFLSTATAAPPAKLAWSPYAPGSAVNDVAMADAAGYAFAALAAPATTSQSQLRYDVVALNLSSGVLWTNDNNVRAPGRDDVAAAADGSAVLATARAPAVASPTNPGGGQLRNVAYYRTFNSLTTATAAPAPFMAPAWSLGLAGGVVAAALSDNGQVVAVAEPTSGARATVRAYDGAGRSLAALDQPANVTDLALTADGARVAIAGDEPGGLGRVTWAGTRDGARDTFTTDAVGAVTAVDVSADGRVLVAGTADGRVLVFRPSGAALGPPERTFVLGHGAVSDVAVATSGRGAVVGAAAGFAHLRIDDVQATIAANMTVAQPARAVDLSRDGSYFLVVARDAYGYAAGRATPLWNLTGPFTGGAMDDEARHLALRRDASVEAYAFTRGLSAVHLTPTGRAASVAAQTPGPDGAVRFPIVVVSNGSSFDRVTLDLPAAAGVAFEANATRFELPPGGERHVEVVARPSGLPPGAYSFPLVVLSDVDGSNVTLDLPLLVAARGGFVVRLQGPAERTLERGASDEAIFRVENVGNLRLNATMRVTQLVDKGAPWTVTVAPERAAVPGGGSTTVVLRVTPPASSPNGTTNRVTLTAQSDQGIFPITVTYVLSPDLGVHLDTPSRVRFVGPAQSTWFNLTIVNTGSVRTAYELAYEVVGQTGGGWNVDVDLTPFNLTSGGTRTVPLRVFAPNDGQSTDRVTLFVEARTLAKVGRKPLAAENLTLIANLNPDLRARPPDFVPDDGLVQLPSASPALLLGAALVATALVNGGRRIR